MEFKTADFRTPDFKTTSRRTFLTAALGAPMLAALAAACGSSGPSRSANSGGGGPGSATYWFLTGQPQEGIRNDTVKRFNEANPDRQDQCDHLPERRLQDEDQDGDRRRSGAHDHLGLGRRRHCAAT